MLRGLLKHISEMYFIEITENSAQIIQWGSLNLNVLPLVIVSLVFQILFRHLRVTAQREGWVGRILMSKADLERKESETCKDNRRRRKRVGCFSL
jgi:hypothetical protein